MKPRLVVLFVLLGVFSVPNPAYSQSNPAPFEYIDTGIIGVWLSAVEWGDYDADGDLDLLVTGLDDSYQVTAEIFRNDNGSFTDLNAGLPGIETGCVAWGDYEGDGDLDVFLAGVSSNGFIGRLYRNDAGVFVDTGANLPAVQRCSMDIADYDDDGDIDVLISGNAGGSSASGITEVYRNDGGSFVGIGAGLPGIGESSVDWGDYDGDGDLDIFLMGWNSSGAGRISRIYRNDNGAFVDIGANLVGLANTSGMFGDYDGDGDLDVVLTGHPGYGSQSITKIYRNDSGTFYDVNVSFPTRVYSVKWGDYDSDGDLDLLAFGETPGIFTNVGNDTFTELAGVSLPATQTRNQSVAWGDYDGNGALDFVITGQISQQSFTDVYRNTLILNEPPVSHAGSDVAIRSGDSVSLDGTASFDDNDPLSALSAAWTISASPTGSLASLDDASSFTPLLATDLTGTYVLSLTVTDTAGLTSDPDEVIISTDNLAPTAVINADPVVVEGSFVTLDGSASTDPENDPLSFGWTLSVPAGSSAVLSDNTDIAPTFVADIVGDYLAMLTVSDAIGPGAPASATMLTISSEDYASGLIDDAVAAIASTPEGDIDPPGLANPLTNLLTQAVAALQNGDIGEAIQKLEKALTRVDGCAERGAPDGKGKDYDWVTTCPSQAPIYEAVSEALGTIQQ